MKRIISSLGLVAFAGAVLTVGATGAFFTDSESSVGNVFTAGSLTFQIDSAGFVHNGVKETGTDENGNDATWDAGEAYNQFLYFEDVIPGDRGVRNLSLHNASDSEDAYVCLQSEETSSSVDLGDEIEVFAWIDPTQDYKYGNSGGEVDIMDEPISINEFNDITFADSEFGDPVVPYDTEYLVIAWCAGTMTIDESGDSSIYPGEEGSAILCDGAGMTTQGESYVADMTVYAEQVANNESFTCGPTVFAAE